MFGAEDQVYYDNVTATRLWIKRDFKFNMREIRENMLILEKESFWIRTVYTVHAALLFIEEFQVETTNFNKQCSV